MAVVVMVMVVVELEWEAKWARWRRFGHVMVRMSSRMLTDVNDHDNNKLNIKTVERGSDGYTCVPALKRWAA